MRHTSSQSQERFGWAVEVQGPDQWLIQVSPRHSLSGQPPTFLAVQEVAVDLNKPRKDSSLGFTAIVARDQRVESLSVLPEAWSCVREPCIFHRRGKVFLVSEEPERDCFWSKMLIPTGVWLRVCARHSPDYWSDSYGEICIFFIQLLHSLAKKIPCAPIDALFTHITGLSWQYSFWILSAGLNPCQVQPLRVQTSTFFRQV